MESNKGINLREAEIIKFSDISRKIRRKTIKLAYVSEYAHPDPSLSITGLLVALYYSELNIDPSKPRLGR